MAGYWPNSLSQVHDANGRPYVGARAFFYQGGTTTPLDVFRDYGLGIPHTNPLQADGRGVFPSVFLDEADGFYRVRVTTSGGTLLYDADGIPIIGPGEGGGGPAPSPVDPDSIFATGDMLVRYDTGLRTGFVRANARTIGTAISGASERANADTQALYEYLWAADTTLAVLGGRGVSAAADWAANKPLTLPDYRGRALVGLDTMGNIAAGVLPAATALSWSDGAREVTISVDQMPNHNHNGSTGQAGAFTPQFKVLGSSTAVTTPPNEEFMLLSNGNGSLKVGAITGAADHAHTIEAQGGGSPHSNLQPSKGLTVYIRL